MDFAKCLLWGLCAFVVTSPTGAQAGFNFGAKDEANTVSIIAPSSGTTTPAHKVAAPVDSSAPALEIFNERYVPDNVKKKYNLQDAWYGNTQAPASQLRVEDAAPAVEPAAASAPPINLTIISSQPKNYVQSWRARKGENIRDILRRWADREQTELMWASSDVPVLDKDFSYFGRFQDAVNQLVGKASGGKLHLQYRSEGMDPVMMAPASTVMTNAPAPMMAPVEPDPMVSTLPVPVTATPPQPSSREPLNLTNVFQPGASDRNSAPETRWLGLSGAPLGEVLRVWGEDANVKVIWQAERNYALKSSVSKVGTFEEAVYEALSQYDAMPVRPVGEIYHDPATGQKVLVVRTDAGT